MGACASAPREVEGEAEAETLTSTTPHTTGSSREVTNKPVPPVTRDGRQATAHRDAGVQQKRGERRASQTDVTADSEDDISQLDPSTSNSPLNWPTWLLTHAGESLSEFTPRDMASIKRISQVGQGTYGAVYKCYDETRKQLVAVKKIKPVRFDSNEACEFATREITILTQLKNHPHAVQLLDIAVSVGVDGDNQQSSHKTVYLVFEFVEHDLAGLMSATEPGGLRLGQVKRLAWQLFKSLEQLHSSGVLHRDIKGSNLLVDSEGTLKLADFGLAVDIGEDAIGESEQTPRRRQSLDDNNKFSTELQKSKREPLTPRVVTLWYRPPELLLGATEYDGRVDVWSAGCLLAELISGEPPFPGRTEVEQLGKILRICGGANGVKAVLATDEKQGSKGQLKGKKKNRSKNETPTTQLDMDNNDELLQALGVTREGDLVFSHNSGKRKINQLFRGFPTEALDLLEKILVVDPKHRLNATEVLAHPFFTSGPCPEPLSLNHLENNHEFSTRRRQVDVKNSTGVSCPLKSINVLSRGETFDPMALGYLVLEKRKLKDAEDVERDMSYGSSNSGSSSNSSQRSSHVEMSSDESSDCEKNEPPESAVSSRSVLTISTSQTGKASPTTASETRISAAARA